MILWEVNAKEKHEKGQIVSFYIHKDNPKYDSNKKKDKKNFPYFEQEFIKCQIIGAYIYAEHHSPTTWRMLGKIFELDVFDKEEYEKKTMEYLDKKVIWEKDLYTGRKNGKRKGKL